MAEFRYTRPDRFPPIVKNLIIINVLVWVAQLVLHKELNLTNVLALHPLDSPDLPPLWSEFKPYQVVTHMFAHASFGPGGRIVFYHILFNMFTLWMFGRVLENIWGAKRFLFFYLACGLGAAACHLLVQHLRFDADIVNHVISARDQATFDEYIGKSGFLAAAVGASGAIMGVMTAFAFLFPNTELMLLFLPVPIKAKYFILGLALIDLFSGVANLGDNIAHFAHLGGAITGFIIVLIWNKTNRRTFY